MLQQHYVANTIIQVAEYSQIHCCKNCIGVQNSPLFFIHLYIDFKSDWNLLDERKYGASPMPDVK